MLPIFINNFNKYLNTCFTFHKKFLWFIILSSWHCTSEAINWIAFGLFHFTVESSQASTWFRLSSVLSLSKIIWVVTTLVSWSSSWNQEWMRRSGSTSKVLFRFGSNILEFKPFNCLKSMFCIRHHLQSERRISWISTK